MTLHIAHLPKLIARRSSTAILGTIIIAMLWVGIGVKYFERAHNDQSEAERTNENFAMVFEENVLRTLSELDYRSSIPAPERRDAKGHDRLRHHPQDHADPR